MEALWEEREKWVKIQTLPRITFSVGREGKGGKVVEMCVKNHWLGKKLPASISGARAGGGGRRQLARGFPWRDKEEWGAKVPTPVPQRGKFPGSSGHKVVSRSPYDCHRHWCSQHPPPLHPLLPRTGRSIRSQSRLMLKIQGYHWPCSGRRLAGMLDLKEEKEHKKTCWLWQKRSRLTLLLRKCLGQTTHKVSFRN